MNEYEFEHTHCYEGAYTLEEVDLNNKLYEECVKEEINLDVDVEQYLFCIPNTYVYSGFDVKPLDFFMKCKVKNMQNFVIMLEDLQQKKQYIKQYQDY